MKLFSGLLLVNLGLLLSSLITVNSSNVCNLSVKMKQVLRGEGFHRNITYGIVFNMEHPSNRRLYKDCIVGVDQTLPPGVFANPDELNDLRRMRKLSAVPKNKINIELPAEQSSPSSVYIIGKVMGNKVYLWLPVHARYHHAAPGGGMARNEVAAPKLYLRCPDQRLDVCDNPVRPPVTLLCNGSSNEKCKWREIPYTLMTDTLIWDVPIGNTNHYYIVATTTATTIIVGSLYLLKIIHEYKVAVRKKKQY